MHIWYNVEVSTITITMRVLVKETRAIQEAAVFQLPVPVEQRRSKTTADRGVVLFRLCSAGLEDSLLSCSPFCQRSQQLD